MNPENRKASSRSVSTSEIWSLKSTKTNVEGVVNFDVPKSAGKNLSRTSGTSREAQRVQETTVIVVHLRLNVNFGPILEIGKVRENLVLETL